MRERSRKGRRSRYCIVPKASLRQRRPYGIRRELRTDGIQLWVRDFSGDVVGIDGNFPERNLRSSQPVAGAAVGRLA
ncbi:hypothetical protein HPP92_026619 [Vanilla planifolia]|uniref:Uncharacterized protein n=1 Tax=Vanilla planifolia TaxID=51239 RepID=A0A835PG55_VANPL|nr:hypothetical protein HPP92_026619 [Vanilla planifolia]